MITNTQMKQSKGVRADGISYIKSCVLAANHWQHNMVSIMVSEKSKKVRATKPLKDLQSNLKADKRATKQSER